MLELKIPPPIVALVVAAIMWGISVVTPVFEMPAPFRIVAAIVISLLGGAVSLAGAISFRQAKTTFNPLKPEKASSLVTNGIYKVTRNPMYVGLLLVLVGLAVYLFSPVALFGPAAFVVYMNEFQIKPEEQMLSKLFDNNYFEYISRVRRWL